MRAPAIVASVLGADYARLGQEVAELEAAGVDRIQWDIMDCRFVPNLSLSANVVAACRPHATLPTPILQLVTFLLVLDVLVLLGRSHDSRDGRDWQPRGSPSPGPSAVAPI